MTTLVLFPLQEELTFFLTRAREYGLSWTPSRIGRLIVFKAAELDITLARGGTGKAQFALQTQHLLDSQWSWQRVICAGAAGALVDDVSIADVVVATVTVEHDYRNRFSERPLPLFAGDPRALETLRKFRPAAAHYRVHFGPIASGDEDIMAAERRRELHAQTSALAAAWEGAGGARACAFSRVPYLEIRGITDAADLDAAAAFEDNLARAMSHIADLLLTWLRKTDLTRVQGPSP